jgi:hypothetical protein
MDNNKKMISWMTDEVLKILNSIRNGDRKIILETLKKGPEIFLECYFIDVEDLCTVFIMSKNETAPNFDSEKTQKRVAELLQKKLKKEMVLL